MKKILISLLILGAFSLSGCGDKEAREYAAKLIPVLDSYQEQLSQKIKAEQDSYNELAATYEQARQDDVKIRLTNDRKRRSEEQGEKVGNAKDAPTLSQILASLQEYGKSDFETTQVLLQEGMDTRSKYLTDLESIELELQKIKLLKQALTELSKPKGDFRNFKEAADLILKTDQGITKQLCVDLKKQLAELTADKAAATKPEDKKKIQEKIDRLNERIKTKKCPDA